MRSFVLLVLVACGGQHTAAIDASIDTASDARPDAAVVAHRGFPPIAYHGGHVLQAMKLVVITAPSEPLATQLGAFCDELVHSTWWSAVTHEYNLGAPRGCVRVTGAAITAPATLTDAQLQTYIGNAIAGNSTIAPDGQTMYMLFLPPQVQFPGNCSYSGYHEPYGTLGDGWGVAERCQYDYATMLEALTVVGSHEVVEAATDPDDKTGWGLKPAAGAVWNDSVWAPYDGPNFLVEVGDFCEGSRIHEGNFDYQRSYSSAAAATGDDPCVPATPVPYYNLTVPQDWYAIAPGGTIDIPLTGWTKDNAEPWQISFVSAEHAMPAPPTTAKIVGPKIIVGTTTYNAMTAGQTSMLEVTMGPAATSGTWRTYWLSSFRVDAAGNDGLDGDDHTHIWRVGVYVP